MLEAFSEDTLHIRWSCLIPANVVTALNAAMDEAEQRIARIASQPTNEADFASTFLALEEATSGLDRAWGRVEHLDAVSNSDALRAVYNEMLPKISAFYAQISLNDPLWEVLKSVSEQAMAQQPSLSPIHQRLLEETMRSFRQNGADLPPERKARLEVVKRELAEKTQKYSENVLDATNSWELVIDDKTRLSGLPENAVNAAKASAKSKGHGTDDAPRWRFTLQAPSLMPVLTYADDPELRREVWGAFSQLGRIEPYKNTELIGEILALRDEMAHLLGKTNFADYVLEPRMAKNGETALGFVEDLHRRITDQFHQEIAELQAFKAERTGGPSGLLEPWELGYWSEKLRRQRYDFDAEALRPYFAIDQVIAGMFALVEETFDLRIQEKSTVYFDSPPPGALPDDRPEVWHPEVKFYELHDASGEHLGSFYADWHPRESKRGGAWMNYLRTGAPGRVHPDGKREPHVGLICGNLTPSVDGQAALLTHSEVETIFHEFGHLLHHLLGDVEVKSLNGVNVVWDFVELPSQIMENFCWARVSLDRFARHYETGEPIPEELFARMNAARHFQAAILTMRQLSFAKMDLELHMHHAKIMGQNLDSVIEAMLTDYTIPTKTPRPNNSHSFTHLFASATGYAAGYYSYKWAEVLDADAFTRFEKDGVISRSVGKDFRDKILSQGNARDANALFHDFMGRDPQLDALLQRSGLAKGA